MYPMTAGRDDIVKKENRLILVPSFRLCNCEDILVLPPRKIPSGALGTIRLLRLSQDSRGRFLSKQEQIRACSQKVARESRGREFLKYIDEQCLFNMIFKNESARRVVPEILLFCVGVYLINGDRGKRVSKQAR